MALSDIKSKKVLVNVEGDRPRDFRLGFMAFAYLAEKHESVMRALEKFSQSNGSGLTAETLDVMVDFVYAGLLSDARKNKENLTRETVIDLLDTDYQALMLAITESLTSSIPEGGSADPTPTLTE